MTAMMQRISKMKVHVGENIIAASAQAKAVKVGVGVLICKGDRVLVGKRCSFPSWAQRCVTSWCTAHMADLH